MKNVVLVLLVVLVILSFGATAEAHHPLGEPYILGEMSHIEGKVVLFIFRNPHSFIFLQEAGHDEKRWSLEWASAKRLSHQGVQRDTIRVGDYLAVTGHPPRKQNVYRMLVQSLTRRGDGFSWGGRKGETVDGFSILGPYAK